MRKPSPEFNSEPDIHIPTVRDITRDGNTLLISHGELIRAQAKSVIAQALRRGAEPAAAATLFAAMLLQLVIDERADADEYELSGAAFGLIDSIRDWLVKRAMADELNSVVVAVR